MAAPAAELAPGASLAASAECGAIGPPLVWVGWVMAAGAGAACCAEPPAIAPVVGGGGGAGGDDAGAMVSSTTSAPKPAAVCHVLGNWSSHARTRSRRPASTPT